MMSSCFETSQTTGLTDIAPAVDLRGRTALITGGADGIGRAVAKAYHRFGAHVIVLDIQGDKLESLATELGHSRITPIKFDLSRSDEATYEDLLTQVKTASPNGIVDVYCINAGVIKLYDGPGAKSLLTTPMGEMDKLFTINVRSHVAIMQKLWPLLQASDAGRVILTSSPIVGRKDPASAHYAWTKKALEDLVAMTHSDLRAHQGSGNILVTGYVPPPVQAWLRAHWKNEPLYSNPMPEDVTELPLRLASPALKKEHDGTMFTLVDKRRKGIVPKDGGEPYDANNRTANGYDLGIRTRKIGESGGTEGTTYLETYDTWQARQLLGLGPVPALDEAIRLRDVLTPPQFVADAIKNKLVP